MKLPLRISAAGLLLLVLYLPFVNQAFHIDDPFFVAMGDQVLKDWTRPLSFHYNWLGKSLHVFENSVNPPLQGYFLGGIMALYGHREWALHLFSFIFVAIFFLAMVDLGRRFRVSPIGAGLLASVTPAVMVTGHTLTPDMSLAAFYTAALACFIRGCDSGRTRWLWAAGACGTAAVLFRYTGLSLLPLMVLYALLGGAAPLPVRLRRAGTALFLPVFFLSGWSLLNFFQYGVPHLAFALRFNQKYVPTGDEMTMLRFLALICYLGGTTLFPFSLVWLGVQRKARSRFLTPVLLLLSGAFALFLRFGLYHTAGQAALAFLLFSAGLIGVHQLLVVPLRGRKWNWEEGFLTLWFAGIFLSCVFQRFAAVRRILLLVPAWVLLYLRRTGSPVRWWTVAGTALLGLALSVADFSQAEVYRGFARDLALRHKSAAGTTWCSGHWGFQYYMERVGLKEFDVEKDAVRYGDRLLIASEAWPQMFFPNLDTSWPMPAGRTVEAGPQVTIITSPVGPLPLHTVSRMAKANFYGDMNFPGAYAFLPYSFAHVPLEKFTIFRRDRGGAVPPGKLKTE